MLPALKAKNEHGLTQHELRPWIWIRRAGMALSFALLLAALFSPAFDSNARTPAQAGISALSRPATGGAEFMQAADEVLAQMSKLLSLPVLEPLKKSVRSREQIRAYLVKSMREEKRMTSAMRIVRRSRLSG